MPCQVTTKWKECKPILQSKPRAANPISFHQSFEIRLTLSFQLLTFHEFARLLKNKFSIKYFPLCQRHISVNLASMMVF